VATERLFCSKPFEWFEVTQLGGRGAVYLCCPTWLNVPAGNLGTQSVEEIWNSPAAQEIRKSILDGSFRYCDRGTCPYLQTESGPVTPVQRVEDPDLRRVIADNLTRLPRGPKKVICTYDQSCNLSCPSCRTERIVEVEHRDEILAIQEKLRSQALRDADYLHITGSGDPFGSPFFRRWLQTMSRAEVPGLERLHLHSNGLLWTPWMWSTISEEIRRVIKSAEISIDAATSGTYAINRRGGRFEALLENLEFIRTLRRQGPLEYVKISMVVQENNFREMPDFVRLGQRLGFDAVYFGQLVNWGTFSDEEFRRRAVHLPGHPRHREFVRLLQDPIFDGPIVDLGNLTDVRRSGWSRQGLRHLWKKVTNVAHR
jgi:hypothetical protein